MGLAASQARLLTITARLADNELRSQTINNAKMRLATQSAQASDAYVSALNNAQLMFTNTNENGLAQTMPLTFNSLTQYSQYNNQYGLVNSSGQTLVSEKDAKIFESNKTSLEGFLKAHGLEWETTYFDETSGDLVDKLQSFYTGDYQYIGNLFTKKDDSDNIVKMNNKDLKNLYLDSISEEASIENVNYTNAARNYYNMLTSLKTEIYPDLRTEILGSSTAGIDENLLIEEVGTLGNAQKVIQEFIMGNNSAYSGIIDNSIDNGALFSLNYLENHFKNSKGDKVSIITDSASARLRELVASLVDVGSKSGFATSSSEFNKISSSGTATYYKDAYGNQQTYDLGSVYQFKLYYKTPKADLNGDGILDEGEEREVTFTIEYKDLFTQTGTYNSQPIMEKTGVQSCIYATTKAKDAEGNYTVDASCDFKFNGNSMDATTARAANNGAGNLGKNKPGYVLDLSNPNTIDNILLQVSGATSSAKETTLHYYNLYPDSTAEYRVGLVPLLNKHVGGISGNATYKLLAEQYLNILLNSPDTFDAFNYLSTRSSSDPLVIKYGDSKANYGIYTTENFSITYPDDVKLLLDFDELIKTKGITLDNSSSYMKSVLKAYMVEKMVDVRGEPKYGWVDKSNNPTGNPDSKAQWLTNLFNRMQKGYKVLENGLASSKEWLEYALESGLVTMEQVDLSYNWVGLDYKSCASINEDTDNSALVAKAEAEYNRAMNDIKQKDSLYDLQLKNIDTEHNALQTEYDVVKGVISKNIERTMKFDQSA